MSVYVSQKTNCISRIVSGFKISDINDYAKKSFSTNWDDYIEYYAGNPVDYSLIAEYNLQKSDIENYNVHSRFSPRVVFTGSDEATLSYELIKSKDVGSYKPNRVDMKIATYYNLFAVNKINGKIKFDEIESDTLSILEKPTYLDLFKNAVLNSDGVVIASDETDRSIIDLANIQNKPVLKCGFKEGFEKEYLEFYSSKILS